MEFDLKGRAVATLDLRLLCLMGRIVPLLSIMGRRPHSQAKGREYGHVTSSQGARMVELNRSRRSSEEKQRLTKVEPAPAATSALSPKLKPVISEQALVDGNEPKHIKPPYFLPKQHRPREPLSFDRSLRENFASISLKREQNLVFRLTTLASRVPRKETTFATQLSIRPNVALIR